MSIHEKYIHYKDANGITHMTVCLVFDGERVARGISIKSPKDNPCHKTSRELAKERAFIALHSEGRRKRNIYGRQREYLASKIGDESWATQYQEYMPELTEYQQHIVTKTLESASRKEHM